MSEEITDFKRLVKSGANITPKDTDYIRLTRTSIQVGIDAARKIVGKDVKLTDQLSVQIEFSSAHNAVRLLPSEDVRVSYTLRKRANTGRNYVTTSPAMLRDGLKYGIYVPLEGQPNVYKLDVEIMHERAHKK